MAWKRSRLRNTIRDFLYVPAVKKSVEMMPVIRKIYPPWQRTHPIDRLHGIDTGGFVGVEKIHHDKNLIQLINPYGGSQPSIVYTGLAALGDVRNNTFVDLGCGKGRAITVASEFPFRKIVGIELSADLASQNMSSAGRCHGYTAFTMREWRSDKSFGSTETKSTTRIGKHQFMASASTGLEALKRRRPGLPIAPRRRLTSDAGSWRCRQTGWPTEWHQQAWELDDTGKAERLLRNLARRLDREAPGVVRA
jgi:hypothetical protein